MPLDRTLVVDAALDLLDEVGLDALTLRRLADRLGVKAPAIYWHVRDKQQLLDEMATAMMRSAIETGSLENGDHGDDGDDGEDATGDRDGTELLTTMAVGLRRTLMSRRDGGKLYGGTYITDPSVLDGTEPVLQRLVEVGFTLDGAVAATRTLFCYVLGFVIEEQGTRGREHLFDPDHRTRRIDPGAHPLNAGASELMFGDFDRLFDIGVRSIVAGVSAQRGLSGRLQ